MSKSNNITYWAKETISLEFASTANLANLLDNSFKRIVKFLLNHTTATTVFMSTAIVHSNLNKPVFQHISLKK